MELAVLQMPQSISFAEIVWIEVHTSSANSRSKCVPPIRFTRGAHAYEITKPTDDRLHIVEFFRAFGALGNLVSGSIVAESLRRNQYTFVTVKVQVLVMILFSVLSLFGFYGFNM